MYNVDTISLGVNFREHKEDSYYIVGGKQKQSCNWNKILEIDKKIQTKLYFDETNKKKLEKECKKIALSKEAKIFYSEITNKRIKKRSIYKKGRHKEYYFTYNTTWNDLTIMVKHKAIEKYTSEEILKNLEEELTLYFGLEREDIKGITLRRIDIKTDYRYKNEEELEIIKNIVQKVKDMVRGCKKEIVQDDKKGYTVRFIAKKQKNEKDEKDEKDEEDEDSNSSGYTETVIYDKGKEMKENAEDGKAAKEEADNYKNIVRIELRIKNGRLNSEKKITGEAKDLLNFYNEQKTTEYFNKYVGQIFGVNKFYRIDKAIEIVKGNSEITDKYKEKLIRVLKLVNRVGYTTAEILWTNRFCRTTFLKHKADIEKLGINIITFNKKINGKLVEAESINNFSLLENGIKE